jgi:hypothetical protein
MEGVTRERAFMVSSVNRRKAALLAGIVGVVCAMALPSVASAGLLSGAKLIPGGSSGSAINLGDVIKVSESTSTTSGSNWSAVTIADQSLLGKTSTLEGNDDNQWSGALSGLGGVVDGLNDALCGVDTPEDTALCIQVLQAGTESPSPGNDDATAASFGNIATVGGAAGGNVLAVVVGNSESVTNGNEDCYETLSLSNVAIIDLGSEVADPEPSLVDPSAAGTDTCAAP